MQNLLNPHHENETKIKEKFAAMSDRELQENLLFHTLRNEANLKSIKLNVQFFFWATVVSVAITAFALTKL